MSAATDLARFCLQCATSMKCADGNLWNHGTRCVMLRYDGLQELCEEMERLANDVLDEALNTESPK